jgi:transposase
MSTKPVMDTSLTGRRRYRAWPDALKREIVAASHVAGASVAAVARRYEVNANQVFAWRKLYRGTASMETKFKIPALIPVTLAAEAGGEDVGNRAVVSSVVEIALPTGYRLRLDNCVTSATLRRVLDVLERR